jgi:DNA-binding PadR family transcriptional regulator
VERRRAGANRTAGFGYAELVGRMASVHAAVRWALLGLVIERREQGYVLAQRFAEAYGKSLARCDVFFIYRTLEALQRRGLIEAIPDRTSKLRQRTIYQATKMGNAHYQRHMIDEIERLDVAAGVYMRKLAVFAKQPQEALRVIDRFEALCSGESDSPERLAETPTPHGDSQALAQRLHAQALAIARSAALEWLQCARGEIQAL